MEGRLLLSLPHELQEILLVYCGFALANTCRRLRATSLQGPVRTHMLLTVHNILAPAAMPVLPPPPLGPFMIGPTEERYSCFLNDPATREDDALMVFRLHCATRVYAELVCEVAVTKRWLRLWCALFPLPPPHADDEVAFPRWSIRGKSRRSIRETYGKGETSEEEDEEGILFDPYCFDTGGVPGLTHLMRIMNADNALIQASMFDRAELVQWLLYRGVAIPVPPTTSTNTDTSNSSSSKPESPGPAPSTLPLSDIHNLVTLHGLTTALVLSAKHPGALGTLSIVLAHPLADVNACDGSPLAWAARTGGLDAVRLLLAHGADPRARGGIAGLWAAEYGHTAVVRLFVEQGGMDVHAQEEYGLRWAVARGQVETVEYLCTVGAMVDAMGGFALRHAVQMGHDQIVDILLRYGADVSIAGNMANTRDGVDDDNDNANDGSDEEIRSSESMADEGNALVRWALRAHNFALAEKLKETLRANRIRGRMHILDLG